MTNGLYFPGLMSIICGMEEVSDQNWRQKDIDTIQTLQHGSSYAAVSRDQIAPSQAASDAMGESGVHRVHGLHRISHWKIID